ncbi:hypothetical protein [Aliarcobacter sp.]|uniref:hypothetical protein n=1 Tax=Aliarcobacter sp. TaxID=2321116 RepID=UPI003563DB97
MNKKRFIIFIFLNLITLLIMYITSFYYQLGANVKSESWIEPMYQIKDKKVLDIGNQNKIIIVSGSNSLFGINSEKISEITNKSVLNLAVPISQGFDGIYSKYGYSGNDWIKGLSPKYINKLPIDPRNTNNPSFQYLYKSNGKDYKLISHSPEDCKSVEKINKALIDPSRKCWAYGLWSDGAKDW